MTQTQCGCERQNPPDTPSAAPRTVHAGEALGANCMGFENVPEAGIFGLEFIPQTYTTGFCPTEALANGTVFPELASPYTRGC